MKFGYTEDLTSVDFSLPQDHPLTATFLSGKPASLQVYAGCAKWSRKEWLGSVYPKGTPSGQFLHHYSRMFNSIELNSTGYSFKSFKSFEAWRNETPEDFTFSPKFPRQISHFKRLKGSAVEDALRFLELAAGLGTGMGLPILQMPENFTPNGMEHLAPFVEQVAPSRPIAIELRHEGWFSDPGILEETGRLFHEHGVTWVITDTPGRRDAIHQVVSSDRVLIRFQGVNDLAIDLPRIEAWVERLAYWAGQGLHTVYWYAHNEPEDGTPAQCAAFLKAINLRCDLSTRGATLLNES
ncbi:MAG: DUF72 domain-containing protein [Saprospiraceae bacterium]|nr:DUF72 domain-containing protein [Saprospiraceae bacterium]